MRSGAAEGSPAEPITVEAHLARAAARVYPATTPWRMLGSIALMRGGSGDASARPSGGGGPPGRPSRTAGPLAVAAAVTVTHPPAPGRHGLAASRQVRSTDWSLSRVSESDWLSQSASQSVAVLGHWPGGPRARWAWHPVAGTTAMVRVAGDEVRRLGGNGGLRVSGRPESAAAGQPEPGTVTRCESEPLRQLRLAP